MEVNNQVHADLKRDNEIPFFLIIISLVKSQKSIITDYFYFDEGKQ